MSVVMQRLHEDDLTGHLLAKGGFDVLRLPALANAGEVVPIGPAEVYRRAAGEPLHPAREGDAELAETKATGRQPGVPGAVPAGAGSRRGQSVQGGVAAALRDHAGPPAHDQLVQSWDNASNARTRTKGSFLGHGCGSGDSAALIGIKLL